MIIYQSCKKKKTKNVVFFLSWAADRCRRVKPLSVSIWIAIDIFVDRKRQRVERDAQNCSIGSKYHGRHEKVSKNKQTNKKKKKRKKTKKINRHFLACNKKPKYVKCSYITAATCCRCCFWVGFVFPLGFFVILSLFFFCLFFCFFVFAFELEFG